MIKRNIRILTGIAAIVLLVLFTALPVHATATTPGNLAGVVESTWNNVESQIKTIVNNVVFPAMDVILAIALFVKVGMSWIEYKKHGQFEWGLIVVLGVCLVFTLTAPLYIWNII